MPQCTKPWLWKASYPLEMFAVGSFAEPSAGVGCGVVNGIGKPLLIMARKVWLYRDALMEVEPIRRKLVCRGRRLDRWRSSRCPIARSDLTLLEHDRTPPTRMIKQFEQRGARQNWRRVKKSEAKKGRGECYQTDGKEPQENNNTGCRGPFFFATMEGRGSFLLCHIHLRFMSLDHGMILAIHGRILLQQTSQSKPLQLNIGQQDPLGQCTMNPWAITTTILPTQSMQLTFKERTDTSCS